MCEAQAYRCRKKLPQFLSTEAAERVAAVPGGALVVQSFDSDVTRGQVGSRVERAIPLTDSPERGYRVRAVLWVSLLPCGFASRLVQYVGPSATGGLGRSKAPESKPWLAEGIPACTAGRSSISAVFALRRAKRGVCPADTGRLGLSRFRGSLSSSSFLRCLPPCFQHFRTLPLALLSGIRGRYPPRSRETVLPLRPGTSEHLAVPRGTEE